MPKSKKKHIRLKGKVVDKGRKPKEEEESNEHIDYSILVRMELTRLQRQYRLMEGARHNFAEESGTTISRQHKIMTFLHVEKDNLEIDFANASCPQNLRKDEKSRSHITNMMQKYDHYQMRNKACIAKIEEMESQVDKITKRVIHQNLKIQTLFGTSMTPEMANKKLHTLENKLYQMTTRYDTLVSQNTQLRYDINTILMERGRYHKRAVYIKRSVAHMKKRMMEVVDAATVLYETRDELASKIKVLRERNEKESRQHVLELKEWQRLLHGDQKDHSFFTIKSQERDVIEKDEERKYRHERTNEKILDYTLQKYKNSFKEIISLGKISDVDALCQYYMGVDQTNFAQFKYISDLNNEINVVKDAIEVFKKHIQDTAKLTHETKSEQSERLSKRSEELENIKTKFQTLRDYTEERTDEIKDIFVEIDSIFATLDCNKTVIENLLGGSSGINSSHASLCLKQIDNKITEINLEIAALTIRKSVELDGRPLPAKQTPVTYGIKQKFMGGPYKPKVIISGRMDSTEEEAEEEKLMSSHPLSYAELRSSIMEKNYLGDYDTGLKDSTVEFSTVSLIPGSNTRTSADKAAEDKTNEQRITGSQTAVVDHSLTKTHVAETQHERTSGPPPSTAQPETTSSQAPRTSNSDPQPVTESPVTPETQPKTSITDPTNDDVDK